MHAKAKFTYILISLIFWNFTFCQSTAAENGFDASQENIDSKQTEAIYNNSRLFPNNTQLSIAILENGNVHYAGIKRENDTIYWENNSDKIFEIGSITKVFTSTLLANAVLENKVKLDDGIQTYIDVQIATEEQITFKSLANHTSGLPRLPSNLNLMLVDQNNPYKDYNEKKLIEYLETKITLNQLPGKAYDYSNLGAGLLGFTLAKLSNSTYDNLLQNMIFQKYNMPNSSSIRKNIKSIIVEGLTPNGRPTSNWDFDVLAGAGAIFSTVEDLSNFAGAQFDDSNKELSLTHEPTFKINDNLSMGLGWHLVTRNNGKHLIFHNGGTGGYTSSMALDIEHQKGVIILSNVSNFSENMSNIDRLCFELIQSLDED